jgi:hypothetical protein
VRQLWPQKGDPGPTLQQRSTRPAQPPNASPRNRGEAGLELVCFGAAWSSESNRCSISVGNGRGTPRSCSTTTAGPTANPRMASEAVYAIEMSA